MFLFMAGIMDNYKVAKVWQPYNIFNESKALRDVECPNCHEINCLFRTPADYVACRSCWGGYFKEAELLDHSLWLKIKG